MHPTAVQRSSGEVFLSQIAKLPTNFWVSIFVIAAATVLLTGCGRKQGPVSYGYPYQFNLLDNSPSGSPFSRVHVIAEGLLEITTDCSIYRSYPQDAEISVSLNGQDSSTLYCSAAKQQVFKIVAVEGDVVDIVSGPRIRLLPAADVTGNTIQGVSGDAISDAEPTKPLMVVYGDSIASGFGTDIPSRDAWTVLLRSQYEVAVEAWGARSLSSDYSGDFSKLLSDFGSYDRLNSLWLAIGVNDYFAGNDIVQFKAEYALLLNSAHTRFPTTRIFAQTPTVLLDEQVNIGGYTLAEYRAAIADVCKLKSFCNLVDGTTILVKTDLNSSDGVHPTTAGNAKYASKVMNIIQGTP